MQILSSVSSSDPKFAIICHLREWLPISQVQLQILNTGYVPTNIKRFFPLLFGPPENSIASILRQIVVREGRRAMIYMSGDKLWTAGGPIVLSKGSGPTINWSRQTTLRDLALEKACTMLSIFLSLSMATLLTFKVSIWLPGDSNHSRRNGFAVSSPSE